MKIHTGQAIKDLKGKDVSSPDGVFKVGTALSNILLETKSGGKMKMFILAQKCYTEDFVEVDESDLSLIRQAVEHTESYNNLVTGQLLILLENKKEDDNKKSTDIAK